jgi:PAS domain S-box-containing protein
MANNILEFWKSSPDDPFNVLFAAAPIMMHSIDSEGKLLQVSAFWAKTLGYSQKEMIGQTSTRFLTPISREYAEQTVFPEFHEKGYVHNVEYDFVRKDGTQIPVLMSAVAQYGSDGTFHRSLAILFDNTETKKAQALLGQNQRMEAIGRLVGGVAHDFNNLLSVIQGKLEFLQDDMDSPNRDEIIHDAFGAIRRGASLTQQLLSFGRRAHLQPKKTDMNRVIRDMDGMLRRLMPARIEFESVAAGGLWDTRVDRHQLDTALLNIANNARDAMPETGKITIETSNVRITEEYVASRQEDIEPGRYVMLAVSDTGTGMPENVAEQIFEPFYTTKPIGKGSGLGLSMVYGFVKQSGGAVRVHSEVGFGTTIKLYFPAVGPENNAPEQILTDDEDDGGPHLLAEILVVEDDDEVRKIMASQLRSNGFKVAEASNGDIAHALISTGYKPRVLVTDVVMPGSLQGPKLAKMARQVIDDLQVIFVSGYPNEASISNEDVHVNDVQLVKPVNRATLLRKVKKMLDDD